MGWSESLLVVVSGLFSLCYHVKGDSLCISNTYPYSSTWCYGDDAYCCYDGSDTCCYHTFVYQYWWFWSIWVIIFFSIVSCVICLRRRRARQNYIRFGQPQYGSATVVATTTTTSNAPVAYPQGYPAQQGYPQQGYPQSAQQGYQQPAAAGYPTAPPTYSDVAPPGYTPQEKSAPPQYQQ
ncbi:WW domain binding protein 1-like [Pecten maximus]|uniref:WW domain binding protein 1-like n=1 Tax=Pecten maximus TaxID=6579 RepID=UPI001458A5F9|nr:WW domain binding protein 1-like [Pecten maximus]